jgi:hypothetical protein
VKRLGLFAQDQATQNVDLREQPLRIFGRLGSSSWPKHQE